MKRRPVMFLLSFLIIYLFHFFIPRLMPGDPFAYTSSVSGEDDAVSFSEEQKEYMRAYYGMDKPLWRQLVDTVKRNLSGDFGQSLHYKRAAGEVIRERLPWTLFIMTSSLAVSFFAGSSLALWSVRNHKADGILFSVMSAAAEIPSYLTGILLLFLVAARVRWIPLSGAMTPFAEYDSLWEQAGDVLRHGFLPVTAMCLCTAPGIYFTARASFLSVAGQAYVMHGKAKGLKEGRIRRRYILANGLTPVMARLFLSVGSAIGGTLLVENVFAYPGLGVVMREAVKYRDYVMIQDIFLLSAAAVLASLVAADVINGAADRKRGGT